MFWLVELCVGNRTRNLMRARQALYHWLKFPRLAVQFLKPPPGLYNRNMDIGVDIFFLMPLTPALEGGSL